MIEKNTSKNDYLIFAIFSSILVFLGWIAHLLAISGFFYSWIVGGFFLLMLLAVICQIALKKISFKISREFALVALAILIFVFISSYFVTPTIFGGRDQGAISEAAIRLSQNHKLEFSTPASEEFFKIYGPGKALNFPGFYYTQEGNLTTQFPIAYISWLTIFYSFFGMTGLVIANAILLFVFLTSFYFISRILMRLSYSVILLVLAATSFPIFWFFKFTLSENMALAFLWLSILWIFLFIKEQKLFYYSSFLISAGLLAFVRIEGIFFLISGFLTAFFFTRKNNFWKNKRRIMLTYPAIFFAILFILNFTKDIYFYKEMAKAFLHIGQNQTDNSSAFNGIFSPAIFEFKVFLLYGLLSLLLLGILGIIYFWTKKQKENLIPFFIIIPSLVYLINPWISSDHPWMLRRFVFSVLPAFIFYSILFLNKWTEEKRADYKTIIARLTIASVLLLNLFLFANYFPFSENKELLAETKEISNNFKDTDLVLVDNSTSGDGWSMVSGPMSFLQNKNSVYFFNINDLDKLDKNKFSKIYLVASDQNAAVYIDKIGSDKIVSAKSYSIETEKLSSSGGKESFILPEKMNVKVSGKILELRITN